MLVSQVLKFVIVDLAAQPNQPPAAQKTAGLWGYLTKQGALMNVNEKIRMLRELNHWSQEEMAERLGMSHNGYAKIERGETKLYLEKLNQIAQIFNIDLSELVANHDKSIFFFLHGTCNQAVNYYGSGNLDEIAEIEKLKLIIGHKDELIAQKDKELAAQQEIIALLKQQIAANP